MVTVLIPNLRIFDISGQEAGFGNWNQGGLPLTPGMGSSGCGSGVCEKQ